VRTTTVRAACGAPPGVAGVHPAVKLAEVTGRWSHNNAWDAVHAATPSGWNVGRPSHHPKRGEWIRYAFDPWETPKVGLRSREWTAVGMTEVDVVRHMARCLAEIRRGWAPN
jgi:hypothetical protein